MLRLFLLGLVLVGLAAGLQRQWLVIDWARLLTDLGVNVSEGDQPIDFHQLIIGDPKSALDTLVREELGLDPQELGSPWGAAGSSFIAFTAGAILPLLPFLIGSGEQPALWSAALSALALFGVGGAVSIFTGSGVFRSGLRMLLIGLLAAAATFGIGRLLGVAVAG